MPSIARWGKSLALKIPKSVAEVCGLKAGTAVTVRPLDNGSVLITPAAGSSSALGAMKPTRKEPDLKDWQVLRTTKKVLTCVAHKPHLRI